MKSPCPRERGHPVVQPMLEKGQGFYLKKFCKLEIEKWQKRGAFKQIWMVNTSFFIYLE